MPENQSSNPILLLPLYLAELMTASMNTHQPMASYFDSFLVLAKDTKKKKGNFTKPPER